jgi:hypothetical protein
MDEEECRTEREVSSKNQEKLSIDIWALKSIDFMELKEREPLTITALKWR